ncbi:hypothetical protein AALP_AA2G232200 [Arabis alpina]|uniref:FAD/NAD(P)-binding domain-containing protein n=1 Tax=Arabis alpina TaxID=50452 RepID=A0A087HJF8_ARAAL|nr:hypothetical protein AALP_AA2G232200 [Arabis alpina]
MKKVLEALELIEAANEKLLEHMPTIAGRISHPNLVRLLGYCLEGDDLLMVYEFMHKDDTLSDGQPIKKKKVVVLGNGSSGYSFLSYLKNPNYDVQVVSPRSFFLFTPLLPSVTNGTVEARSIVEPIVGLMRKKGSEYKEVECVNIDASNKKIHCRWSAGVGLCPFIRDFMQEIGQGQRRVLATDEWLRVEGCDSVYALGDTATINQRKEDIAAIFSKADKGNT